MPSRALAVVLLAAAPPPTPRRRSRASQAPRPCAVREIAGAPSGPAGSMGGRVADDRPRPVGPGDLLRRARHRRHHEDARTRARRSRRSSRRRRSPRSARSRWRRPIRRSSGSAPGEANDRNSSSWGNGVYRSEDAGATWTNVGLADSKTIARIVVHPTDPKTAWVAVMGDLWTPERGPRPLQDDRRRQDLDARRSRRRRRTTTASAAATSRSTRRTRTCSTPRSTRGGARRGRSRSGPPVTDGKDLGGIFKSTDGGAHWTKLDRGLAEGDGAHRPRDLREEPDDRLRGRAVRPGRHRRAGTCAPRAAACSARTTRARTWTRVNPLNPRPFYFSQIRVDPENDQRVYVLGYPRPRLRRRRQVVPRGRLQEGPPRLPRRS